MKSFADVLYDDFRAIAVTCQRGKVGKLLPDALYVHVSALESLDPLLQECESQAKEIASRPDGITLVKFKEKPSISYLSYPDFDSDPHPALHISMEIDLGYLQVHYQDTIPTITHSSCTRRIQW